jgi:hypothetical protein
MPVDDPGTVKVVRRELDPDAVTRQDPDAETAHLAGDMTEDYVIIVELDPEHRIRQSLDDLALELDLFFLGHALILAPMNARAA